MGREREQKVEKHSRNLSNLSIIRTLGKFGQKYKNNWTFYPTGGSGGGAKPPIDVSELFWFFPKFYYCSVNFFKFVGGPPRTPANNALLGG